MRHALTLLLAPTLAALLLAACADTPKPFQHEMDEAIARPPKQDRTEVTIETPANMPTQMAERIAAAIAIELQSYGIVAAVQPAQAPMKLTGAMSTRDAGTGAGIEVEIEWFLLKGRGVEGPAVSKTITRPEDYAAASDRLVSRIAQQAAPRIATLMGKPPTYEARAPGQVAAGVTVPEVPAEPDPVQTASAASGKAPDKAENKPATPAAPILKVMVAPVTGAPSDGNKQLFSGMRRAIGSNKLIVIDKAGSDTYTVTGTVALKPIDERMAQLSVTWVLSDPSGKEIGKVDQSNPVPVAATKGSWAGFGDIVASAAVEGIMELLEKSVNRGR